MLGRTATPVLKHLFLLARGDVNKGPAPSPRADGPCQRGVSSGSCLETKDDCQVSLTHPVTRKESGDHVPLRQRRPRQFVLLGMTLGRGPLQTLPPRD